MSLPPPPGLKINLVAASGATATSSTAAPSSLSSGKQSSASSTSSSSLQQPFLTTSGSSPMPSPSATANNGARLHELIERTGTVLGDGATGVVELARHVTTKQLFAVKTISGINSRTVKNIKREIAAMGTASGDCLVPCYDVHYDKHTASLCMVTEYMNAGSVASVLKKSPAALTEFIVAFIVRSVLRGLGQLHGQGLLHRDIKPANILLSTKSSSANMVRVSDFGLAREMDAEEHTEQTFVGTLIYMAPERLAGHGDRHNTTQYGSASDIWSVGVMTLELLLGGHPLASIAGSFF
eukprot:PhM_4_TR299/c0_g1_i1/m.100272/K04368/MAP2K1, MEK1; mitogen-activated protein kinase kinase 1